MSGEDLQIRYERFLILVMRFRKYQTEWEVYRISRSIENMIRYQREIDKWITREAKILDSKQPELFK
jgi:hypothetical protein